MSPKRDEQFNMFVDEAIFEEDAPEEVMPEASSEQEKTEKPEIVPEASPEPAEHAESEKPAEPAEPAEQAASREAAAKEKPGPSSPPDDDFDIDSFFDDDGNLGVDKSDLDDDPLFDDMEEALGTLDSTDMMDAETGSEPLKDEGGETEKIIEKGASEQGKPKTAPGHYQVPASGSAPQSEDALVLMNGRTYKVAALFTAFGAMLILSVMGVLSLISPSREREVIREVQVPAAAQPVTVASPEPQPTDVPGPLLSEESGATGIDGGATEPAVETTATGGNTAETTAAPEEVPGDHFAGGMALFRDGSYVEAIEEFESDITSANLYIARCYQILGEDREALKRYQHVLRECPERSAFIEVYSLAEEFFANRKYEEARKLYYAFIAQMDRMPDSVEGSVPEAYFKISRCMQEEALAMLNREDGHSAEEEPGAGKEEGALSRKPRGEAMAGFDRPSSRVSSDRIHVEPRQVNGFITVYTVEFFCVPCLQALESIADRAGCVLDIDAEAKKRLASELVSVSLVDRQLEEVFEYLTGQIGYTFDLSDNRLSVAALEDRLEGDWIAMKEEAIKGFRRSLYRFIGHKDAPKVYYEISRLHYLSGDYDSAISPARTLIVEYPEFSQIPLALLNISQCYSELGDFTKATEFLTELINKYANHPAAQEGSVLLARSIWKQGDPDTAQHTLRSMIQRFPDSEMKNEAESLSARIFFSQGRLADAIEILDRIPIWEIERGDSAAEIMLLKAQALLDMGKPGVAAETLQSLLDSLPEELKKRKKEALFLLAESYLSQKELLACFSVCKELRSGFDECRSDPSLYLAAGRVLEEMNLRHRALEWLDQGLEHCSVEDETTLQMYMFLGDLLFDMEKYEKAKVVYRMLSTDESWGKEAGFKILQAQVKQQDFNGALKTAREFLDKTEDDPAREAELFRIAGDCYQALGDLDGAVNAYKGLLKSEGGE